ncbi:hypothetical protein TNCV_524281 [Trichonephila clavipes]|nr:hypothetical protein TNCV_524281 [Trichonephila clavipes]
MINVRSHTALDGAGWKYTRIYNLQRRLRVLVIRCRIDSSQTDHLTGTSAHTSQCSRAGWKYTRIYNPPKTPKSISGKVPYRFVTNVSQLASTFTLVDKVVLRFFEALYPEKS